MERILNIVRWQQQVSEKLETMHNFHIMFVIQLYKFIISDTMHARAPYTFQSNHNRMNVRIYTVFIC